MAFSFISCLDQPFNEKTLSVISAKLGVYYELHNSENKSKRIKNQHFWTFFSLS